MARIALALTTKTCDGFGSADIQTWMNDVAAEGIYTPKKLVIADNTSVADVAKLVQVNCPADTGSHLQLFGNETVPQVVANPDGHYFRAGDVDAPYATKDISAWNWDTGQYAYTANYWPQAACRTVSRIDMSGLV